MSPTLEQVRAEIARRKGAAAPVAPAAPAPTAPAPATGGLTLDAVRAEKARRAANGAGFTSTNPMEAAGIDAQRQALIGQRDADLQSKIQQVQAQRIPFQQEPVDRAGVTRELNNKIDGLNPSRSTLGDYQANAPIANDVSKLAKTAGLNIWNGGVTATQAAINALPATADWIGSFSHNADGSQAFKPQPKADLSRARMDISPEDQSLSGMLTEGFTQFLATRNLMGYGGGTWANRGKDAAALFSGFEGGGRAADFVDENIAPEGMARDFIRMLKTQPGDSDFINRIKNTGEDFLLNLLLHGAGKGLGALKKTEAVATNAGGNFRNAPPVQPPPASAAPPVAPTAQNAPAATPAPPKSMFSSTAEYSVATQDSGSFGVNLNRTHDGGAVIMHDKGTIPIAPEFAKGKSDEELLAYYFEPLGFQGATKGGAQAASAAQPSVAPVSPVPQAGATGAGQQAGPVPFGGAGGTVPPNGGPATLQATPRRVPAAIDPEEIANNRAAVISVSRFMRSARIPSNVVDDYVGSLLSRYEPLKSDRYPLAFFVEEDLPQYLEGRGYSPDKARNLAGDVAIKTQGYGKAANSFAGSGNNSRYTMQDTIHQLTSTQKSELEGTFKSVLGDETLMGRSDEIGALMRQNGQEAYTNSISEANRLLKTGKASPEQVTAAGEINAILTNSGFKEFYPESLTIEATTRGKTVDELIQERLAADPIDTAHWLQSEIGQAARDAKNIDGSQTNMSRAYENMRKAILDRLEKFAGYKGARMQHGDLWGADEAVSFGDRFLSVAKSEFQTERMARELAKLSPRQQQVAALSIRDALLNQIIRLSPEEAPARITQLQNEGTLKALVTVLGEERGTELRNAIANMRVENQRIAAVSQAHGSPTHLLQQGAKDAIDNLRGPGNKAVHAVGNPGGWAFAAGASALLGSPVPLAAKGIASIADKLSTPTAKFQSRATKGLYGLPRAAEDVADAIPPPGQANALASPPPSGGPVPFGGSGGNAAGNALGSPPPKTRAQRPPPTVEEIAQRIEKDQNELQRLLKQYDQIDRADPNVDDLMRANLHKQQLARRRIADKTKKMEAARAAQPEPVPVPNAPQIEAPTNAFNAEPAPTPNGNAFNGRRPLPGQTSSASPTLAGAIVGGGLGAAAPADSEDARIRNIALGIGAGGGVGAFAGLKARPYGDLAPRGGKPRAPSSPSTVSPIKPGPKPTQNGFGSSLPMDEGARNRSLLQTLARPNEPQRVVDLLAGTPVSVTRDEAKEMLDIIRMHLRPEDPYEYGKGFGFTLDDLKADPSIAEHYLDYDPSKLAKFQAVLGTIPSQSQSQSSKLLAGMGENATGYGVAGGAVAGGAFAPDTNKDGKVDATERMAGAMGGAVTGGIAGNLLGRGARNLGTTPPSAYGGMKPKIPEFDGPAKLRELLGEPSKYLPWRGNPAYKELAAKAGKTVGDAPVANIVPGQSQIRHNFKDVPARYSSTDADLPILVKENGKYYINDGTHRIAAQVDDGAKTIRAQIIDLDAVSPIRSQGYGGRKATPANQLSGPPKPKSSIPGAIARRAATGLATGAAVNLANDAGAQDDITGEIRSAEGRITSVEQEIAALKKAKADFDKITDLKEKQRLLNRVGLYNGAIDGNFKGLTTDAINAWDAKNAAALEKAEKDLAASKSELTEMRKRDAYRQMQKGQNTFADALKEAGPSAALILGGIAATVLRVRGVGKSAKAAKIIENDINDLLTSGPVRSLVKKGGVDGEARNRAVNMNQFYREGGAPNDKLPFNYGTGGWKPNSKAVKPGALFSRKTVTAMDGVGSSFIRPNDIKLIGAGLLDSGGMQPFVSGAEEELKNAKEDAEKNKDSVEALRRVERAETTLKFYQTIQRFGFTLAGTGALGAAYRYKLPKPDIRGAEDEVTAIADYLKSQMPPKTPRAPRALPPVSPKPNTLAAPSAQLPLPLPPPKPKPKKP